MEKKYFWRGFLSGSVVFIILIVFLYIRLMVQPDLTLSQIKVQDLNGQKVELTKYVGKPFVVNYWGTWCGPCVKELPHFNEVKNKLGDEVNFIMISDEPIEKITKFKNSKEYTFNYLQTIVKLSDYGINARPVTYFYNSSGTLVDKYTGGLTVEKLEELIDKIK